MDEKEIKNSMPMIINKGIIYNKKDISKILKDLNLINYEYIIDNKIIESGKAYIMNIFSNNSNSTMIINKKAYINVNGFEYLEIQTNEEETILDLHNEHSILKIKLSNNIENIENNQLPELMSPQSIKLFNSQNYDDDIFVEMLDDDSDED